MGITMEEQTLSEYCRKGNDAARKELYEKYANRLFGICLRYVCNTDAAKDIFQDGFLKIYQSFDKFIWRSQGSLRAWLDRIMINEALQYLRLRHNMKIVKSDILIEEIENHYHIPDPETIERIPEEILMQFIAELPDGYRTVFNLFAIEGKSHREIACILHINEKSSSSQYHRAKSILAKRINEWTNEENTNLYTP